MPDRHHFEEKSLNRHNSAMTWRIAMKFGMMTHYFILTLLNLATDKKLITRTCPLSIYSKRFSRGQIRCGADADGCAYWRHLVKNTVEPSVAAAMRPHIKLLWPLVIMVALCNRSDHYIFILFLLLSSFFSSPNLSSRRLDVYHTSAHGVVLV